MELNDGNPEQTEDRPEDEALKKPGTGRTVVVACVAVLAVCAAIYSASRVSREEQRRRAALGAAAGSGYAIPDPVGAEDAPIQFTVILGHCVAPAMDNFVRIAEAWPDKIHADFYAYESVEGSKIIADHGETLACIFVNGENRFTVETDGETRELHFHGPPGGPYNMRDVVDVLRMKMLDHFGELPPDFDDVTGGIGAPATETAARTAEP